MKKNEKIKIAENVRIYRAVRRISQTEFGRLSGMSQRIVSLIENEEFTKVSESKLIQAQEAISTWSHTQETLRNIK